MDSTIFKTNLYRRCNHNNTTIFSQDPSLIWWEIELWTTCHCNSKQISRTSCCRIGGQNHQFMQCNRQINWILYKTLPSKILRKASEEINHKTKTVELRNNQGVPSNRPAGRVENRALQAPLTTVFKYSWTWVRMKGKISMSMGSISARKS